MADIRATRFFLAALFSFNCLAQTSVGHPPVEAFEVASVRLASQESMRYVGPRFQTSHGSLTTYALPLRACIQWAYQIQSPEVVGPDWLDSVRLDIVAKAGFLADEQQLFRMLRTLLADRLGIKAHVERKDMSVYTLTPAKGGPKVSASTTEGPRNVEQNNGVDIYQRWSIYELVAQFSNTLGRPVVNATGLRGRYDFRIDPNAVSLNPREVDKASFLIAAIQEQLGLNVESRKQLIDVLVIDHAERTPTEN